MFKVKSWRIENGNFFRENLKTKFSDVNKSFRGAVDIVCSSNGVIDFLFLPEKSFILMINLQTGKTVRQLVGHYGSVSSLAYSPGSMELYSGAKDKNILIWEAETSRVQAWLDNKHKGTEEEEENKDQFTRDTWSSDED